MRLLLIVLFNALLISGCCHSKQDVQNDTTQNSGSQRTGKAGLADNQSNISGVVTLSYKARGGDFLVKVKVLKVAETGKAASIAVAGEEYLLAPAFVLNEKGEKEDNARNRNLSEAGAFATGDSVTATIFMQLERGWFFTEMKKAGK